MPLVESKKFMTTTLKIYAVVNFIIYGLVFYTAYRLSPEAVEPGDWRLLSILAFFVGCIVAVLPALARLENKGISLNGETNHVLYTPIYVTAIYFLVYLVNSYVNWSFSFGNKELLWFCLTYLPGVPMVGVLMFLLWYDKR